MRWKEKKPNNKKKISIFEDGKWKQVSVQNSNYE